LEDYESELEKILTNTAALNKYHIVLDLRQAAYLSSLSLRLLIKYHKIISQGGKVLALLCTDETITKYLAASKLDTLLKIFGDEEALFRAVEHPENAAKQAIPAPFSYSAQIHDSIVVALLSGFLRENAEMKAFEAEIVEHVRQKRLRFVFNLEKLNYIDSLAIGRFVKLANFLKSRGGKAVFCCGNEVVIDLFSAMGLMEALSICATENEARALASAD
ncbi:MAG: STAS domain-containing protein, partial [Fibrobacterota bacterium]